MSTCPHLVLPLRPSGVTATLDSNTTSRAICDDFTTVGGPRECLKVFDSLSNSSLRLNPSKSKLLWPRPSRPPDWLVRECASRDIPIVLGATLALGTTLGLDAAQAEKHVSQTVVSHDRLFGAVLHPRMRTQVSYLLLRYCLQPKLGFLLRTTKPSLITRPCAQFDEKLMTTFFRLLTRLDSPALCARVSGLAHRTAPTGRVAGADQHLFSSVLKLAPKPIRHGGFGLRLSSAISPVAYWSAMALAAKEIEQFTAVPALPQRFPSFVQARDKAYNTLRLWGTPVSPAEEVLPDTKGLLPAVSRDIAKFYESIDPTSRKLQRLITRSIEELGHKADLADADTRTKALLRSCTGYSAGAWLCAIPSEASLRLQDTHFVVACLLRLSAPFSCRARCHRCRAVLDPVTCVDHFFSCQKNIPAHCTTRHRLLARLTVKQCERSGVTALYEKQPDWGEPLRPDGIQFFPAGQALTDTTVRHPTAKTS